MSLTKTMSDQHEQIKTEWNKSKPALSQVYAKGVQAFLNTLASIQDAFTEEDKGCRCIDEGVYGGINLAGSGILLPKEMAASILRKANVDGIFSHEGCGAAALYASQNGIAPEEADEAGIKWAKSLASILKVPYRGHIPLSDMSRPASFHNARLAFYDGTGKFNPNALEDAPSAFDITRAILPKDYALKEVDIACSIALGDHGFGELFTTKEPFLLVAVANDEDLLNELKEELEIVASKYDGRVKVDGFIATV